MGFDADMRKVTERYKKWGETAVITNDNFAAVDSLIQRHYDDRGRLFDDLINALKRDNGIQSPWDSACDKGMSLHENLNTAIASKIPDGFKGLGMSDFYEGEKKAWEACKGGRIGLMAEVIWDIGQNDVEILKKLDEDLKKAREDSKVIDELVRATFGSIKETTKQTAIDLGAILAAVPAAAIPLIGKVLAPQVKKTAQSMLGGSASVRDMAKRKKAARSILVGNRDMIEKAREQIGDGNIRNIRARCEENANSWKGAGARGDYGAVDWESFARACQEVLRNKESPVLEKAKNLFDVMRPQYIEAINTSFATMMSDPGTIAKFNGELDDDTKKMFDDLAKEDVVIASLRSSEPTKLAVQQMNEIKAELQNALKEMKAAIREGEELLKT
jgi:hypothetical protein